MMSIATSIVATTYQKPYEYEFVHCLNIPKILGKKNPPKPSAAPTKPVKIVLIVPSLFPPSLYHLAILS